MLLNILMDLCTMLLNILNNIKSKDEIITREICIARQNAVLSKLRGAGHCTSIKRMNSILRHVAEAFPPARQWTILNSPRVLDIATNTSMVLNCALVTYCT